MNDFSSVTENLSEKDILLPSVPFWKDALLRVGKNPLALLSLGFLALLILLAIVVPFFSPYSYDQIHLAVSNHPPSKVFWFGTDDLGRDIFTRIFRGARLSLWVGLFAACIDLLIGVFLGGWAGYKGGKWDEFIMRFCDILHAIPQILVVIILILFLGKGLPTLLFSVFLTGWINMARIVRSHTLQLKNSEFVQSAYLLGASSFRIVLRHLFPNLLGTVLATLTLTIPHAIFLEAFLSFLGLGVQPPQASWGIMVGDGISTIRFFPWRIIFPSLFVSLTILSLNLLGNRLRDALDPRLRS